MTEFTQADTPVITDPMFLSEEALRPVNLLEEMERKAREYNAANPTAEPKRGRGRPAGSKNRSTIEREQQTTVRQSPRQRLVTPPARGTGDQQTKTPEQIEAERVLRREARERRVEELTGTITDQINENLMLLLTSMGVPAQLLYKPGRAPKTVAETDKYTEFAGKAIIKPMQASTFAKFYYELEQTEPLKKITGITGDSKAPLLFYGALSILGGIQYAKSLKDFTSELKSMMEQMQAVQAAAEASKRNNPEQFEQQRTSEAQAFKA